MQRWSIAASIVILSLVIVAILPGCNILKKSPSTSSAASSTQSDPSQPLTSNWKMTRTGYQPPFPTAVPGFLVDQVFPKNPVWSITVSGSQLAVTYDGRATWFNPMGMNVKTNPVTATQNADKNSCTFKGGGNLNAAKLPGALSLLGALTGGMEDISVNYTDTIVVTLASPTQISATITYTSSGTYTGGKGPDRFNYPGSLTYTGIKK